MSTYSAGVNKALYIGIGVGGTLLFGGLSYLCYKSLKSDDPPQKWVRVGKLVQVNVFPIKSCAPLNLTNEDEVFCETLGLRYKGIRDRVLMLVDEKYEMVTGRIYPKLVLVSSRVEDETKLIITAKDMEPLELDFATLEEEAPGKVVHTAVWGTKVKAKMCGEKYDKWFSNYILNKDSGLHLIYYPHDKPVRSVVNRLNKEPFITAEDTGAFGDATSFMLMNLASVKDLNRRMPETPVDPLQFRGNFLLKPDSDRPYAEDNWQWLRIGGGAIFRKVAPVTRCIFVNINPRNGERDPAGNPLKKLKSYRLLHNDVSPTLGIHLGLRQPGTIKHNDPVYVEDFS